MRKQKSRIILFVCLLLLSTFSVARLTDSLDYLIIDLFSHFTVQYAFLAFFLSAVCLSKRFTLLAIFAGLLFVLNISVMMDYGGSVQAAGHRSRTFTACSANINKSNSKLPKVVDGLRDTDADILLLLEATGENITALQPLIRRYPYRIVNLNTGLSGTGTVLLSRFPVLNHRVRKYSEFGNMMVYAEMKIDNRKTVFYGVHFPKPTDVREFPLRSEQIISLARQISEESRPVIMAGDFNTTPFSPVFKRLLKESGLKDSRTGFGWLPSWPASFPLFWIPIDHILVSPGIQVHDRTTGPFISSDHYPVFAELSIGSE